MNIKILKYELLLLFFVAAIAILVYFQGDAIPDSYLNISSYSNDGLFSYYFSSFLTGINYYTGAWVLLLFVVQLLLYVTKVSKRADVVDLLLVVPNFLFLSALVYFIKPSLIGLGLIQITKNYFSTVGIFFIFAIAFILSGWGIFRNDFINFIKNLADYEYANSCRAIIEKVKAISLKKSPIPDMIEESVQGQSPVKSNQPRVAQMEILEDLQVLVEVSKVSEAESINIILDEYVEEIAPIENEFVKISEETYFNLVNTLATKKNEQKFAHPDDRYFQDIINKIHNKLSEFKIEGRIINILKGPVVDTFEWELGPGEKISKLTSASEDLSLALLGAPIRMVYPMKGRGTVGIEVPRNPREIIFLDDIINSKEFLNTTHQLPLAMGKDAFGEAVVVDLAAMPHMLVAGATGAGKSVFINAILVSLLIKKSPAQMKLILIDPKQLELALYARLPHLIMPVISDAKTASISLLWAVQEMERRYSIMTEFGVRNIEGFNHKLKRADSTLISNIRKFYEYEVDESYTLPYIVIIVDEFADLILTQSGKDIEKNICRLAGKARAAGIHLVVATQRPSVDVITGLIKANFPTRVSFRVTSAVDSRTILNAMGAEKLLGKGDMLYKYGVDTNRIHSSFIEEDDIEGLTDQLASLPPSFNSHVMEFLENGGEENSEVITIQPKDGENGGRDDKYDDAVRVVIEHRSASASLLQRRLGVGYNRAANLIEEMESNGVVGPAQGSKPRKVLLGSEGIS